MKELIESILSAEETLKAETVNAQDEAERQKSAARLKAEQLRKEFETLFQDDKKKKLAAVEHQADEILESGRKKLKQEQKLLKEKADEILPLLEKQLESLLLGE